MIVGSSGETRRVQFDVMGPFVVRAPNGDILTPTGAKARGILALLLLTDDHSRPRRWLEEMLWSTRPPAQAQASMRQSLSEIRRSLGAFAPLLKTDREAVSLNHALISVDLLALDEQPAFERELFEGLVIKDPRFTEWLEAQRNQSPIAPTPEKIAFSDGIVLRCIDTMNLAPEYAFLRDVITTEIGRNISERVNAWVQSDTHAKEGPAADIELECTVLDQTDTPMAFLRLVHRGSGRVLFSKVLDFDRPAKKLLQSSELASLGMEAAEETISRLANVFPKDRPDVFAANASDLALNRLFSFQASGISQGQDLLDQAFEADQQGVYQAWKSLGFMFQSVELLSGDQQDTREQMDFLSRSALEKDPDNAMVMAITALTQMVAWGRTEDVSILIERSLAANPTGAIGWLAMSVAKGLAGHPLEAYRASAKAQRIASKSRYRHWWDIFHCISSISVNRYDEAILAGEKATLHAPSFRAPYRHLLPLYAHARQGQKARNSAARLRNLEPNFSILRLRGDHDYPVRTLRKTELINFPLQVF